MATIKDEKVIDNWQILIDSAAGKAQAVLDSAEKHIDHIQAPNVACYTPRQSSPAYSKA